MGWGWGEEVRISVTTSEERQTLCLVSTGRFDSSSKNFEVSKKHMDELEIDAKEILRWTEPYLPMIK